MRKILLFASMIFTVFIASSQEVNGFKGFVDVYGGLATGKGYDVSGNHNISVKDIRPLVAFGLNVTEGYQINKNFFAGIGFGSYAIIDHSQDMDKYETWSNDEFHNIMLPLFIDGRWTLDIERKITPFVDIKLGYQISVALNEGCLYGNYLDSERAFVKHEGGFYFQPTFGVRFGKAAAFNLGVSYNAIIKQKILVGEVSNLMNLRELKKSSTGVFMLTFGADF